MKYVMVEVLMGWARSSLVGCDIHLGIMSRFIVVVFFSCVCGRLGGVISCAWLSRGLGQSCSPMCSQSFLDFACSW